MIGRKKESVLKAGVGYTIGNILIRCISILTLPIFSRLLTTEEFGVFNVFMSYDSILFVLVGFALHSSIRSANEEFPGQIDAYTSSVTLIYFAGALILFTLVFAFGNSISFILNLEVSTLYLLIVHSTASALLTLFFTRISLEYSYKKYLLISGISSVGTVITSLMLILTFFRIRKDVGRILGSTITAGILAIVVIISLYHKAMPKIRKDYLAFGLRYSLPIVPHGVSQVLLAQFDRIMISRMVGESSAGIYSLASNLKLIMTVITSSISAVWGTWFYERMRNREQGTIQKRAIQLCALYTILVVGLMALSPEIIWILGGKNYAMARYVAIPMILDSQILFFYDLIVTGEYYSQKTVYIMKATVVAAVLNVLLNYVFIKWYGFIAAAYTTLASYIIYLIIHIVVSRKMLSFYILPLKWLLLYSAITMVMAIACILLMEKMLFRWLLCVMIVIPMTFLLVSSLELRSKAIMKWFCDD